MRKRKCERKRDKQKETKNLWDVKKYDIKNIIKHPTSIILVLF